MMRIENLQILKFCVIDLWSDPFESLHVAASQAQRSPAAHLPLHIQLQRPVHQVWNWRRGTPLSFSRRYLMLSLQYYHYSY